VSPADALALVNVMASAVQGYLSLRENERTTRELIEAQKQVALAEIAERREVFLTYLDRSFDERERNFASLFDALDRAMRDGTGNAAEVLGAITTLAASVPFKDLHDPVAVRKALSDPDHAWDV